MQHQPLEQSAIAQRLDPQPQRQDLRQRFRRCAQPDDLRLFQDNTQHQWKQMDVLMTIQLDLLLTGQLLKPMDLRLDRCADLSPQDTTTQRFAR